MARGYVLRRRAAQMDETRRRIAAAAAELHGTIGPARTTVSAVAKRAGVERLTVYRHFPDEESLYLACSGHWLAQNPPPDIDAWSRVSGAEPRLRRALRELYAYYRRAGAMLHNTLRDASLVPALAGPMAEWQRFLERAAGVLAQPWRLRGRRQALLRGVIGHALDFRVWSSLRSREIDDGTAVDLMVRLARAAVPAGRGPTRPRRA
jgi:AcrR family transcriptional regulator